MRMPLKYDADGRQIHDDDGRQICDFHEAICQGEATDDDARRIVRACNSHDALIEACEKIAEAVGPTQEDGSCYMHGRDLIAARDAALAALAKARGEVMP